MIIDVDIYQQIREMTTMQHMSQRAVAKTLGICHGLIKYKEILRIDKAATLCR